MTTETTEDFLAHFGIKGMKWGIRHDPSRGGGSASGGRRFDTIADLHAREVAKHPKFETLRDVRAKSKAKNRRFDTIADLHAREVAKHPKFDSFRDLAARKQTLAGRPVKQPTAKQLARQKAAADRGKGVLRDANAFNSPSLAIGMKAVGLIMAAGTVAMAIHSLRKPDAGTFRKIKMGMTAAGAVMTAMQAASIGRDIHDVRAYQKSKKASG